jgi:hypothetical protein
MYAVVLYGVIALAGLAGLVISALALVPTVRDLWEALRS